MVINSACVIPFSGTMPLTRHVYPFDDSSDEMISDEEESDKQTLANQAKQVTDTTITTATATTATTAAAVNLYNSQGHKVSQKISGPGGAAKSSEPLATKGTASKVTKSSTQKKPKVTLHSRLTVDQEGTYDKQLRRIDQKLREKTLEELLKMYDGTTEELFRDIIKDAYHEKRMAMLQEWEKQIDG